MKYRINVYSIWEFGQRKDAEGRPHQEDSIYPEFGRQTPDDRLFILCDGMGGHAAGEVASATVCKAMAEEIARREPDPEGPFTTDDFNAALDAAYKALDNADNAEEGRKMGTTMTMLKLHRGGATIAHMGDSRVYHIRPGKDGDSTTILSVTRDHSLVNDLVAVGEITPEEARNHPRKNVITRAMQPGEENRCKADVATTTDIKPGDYFFLCSDGMLEQMDDDALCNIFSESGGDDDNKVRILTAATMQNADNHSAFVVRINELVDDGHPFPMPTAAEGFSAIVDARGTADAAKAPVNARDADEMPPEVPARKKTAGAAAPAVRQTAKAAAAAPRRNGAPVPVEAPPQKSGTMRIVLLAVIALALIICCWFGYKLLTAKDEPQKIELRERVEETFERDDDEDDGELTEEQRRENRRERDYGYRESQRGKAAPPAQTTRRPGRQQAQPDGQPATQSATQSATNPNDAKNQNQNVDNRQQQPQRNNNTPKPTKKPENNPPAQNPPANNPQPLEV